MARYVHWGQEWFFLTQSCESINKNDWYWKITFIPWKSVLSHEKNDDIVISGISTILPNPWNSTHGAEKGMADRAMETYEAGQPHVKISIAAIYNFSFLHFCMILSVRWNTLKPSSRVKLDKSEMAGWFHFRCPALISMSVKKFLFYG